GREVILWDPATGKQRGVHKGQTAGGEMTGLAFTPGGELLAACGGPSTLELWDVLSGKAPVALRRGANANHAAFSPDGKVLATDSWDGVLLWETRAAIPP